MSTVSRGNKPPRARHAERSKHRGTAEPLFFEPSFAFPGGTFTFSEMSRRLLTTADRTRAGWEERAGVAFELLRLRQVEQNTLAAFSGTLNRLLRGAEDYSRRERWKMPPFPLSSEARFGSLGVSTGGRALLHIKPPPCSYETRRCLACVIS